MERETVLIDLQLLQIVQLDMRVMTSEVVSKQLAQDENLQRSKANMFRLLDKEE